MANKKKENTKIDATKESRRVFLRAAAVGVAGVALTASKASATSTVAPAPKAPARAMLSQAEQLKDTKALNAAKIIKELDGAHVEIQWVKGKAPAGLRRVIQMYG